MNETTKYTKYTKKIQRSASMERRTKQDSDAAIHVRRPLQLFLLGASFFVYFLYFVAFLCDYSW